MIFPWNKHLRSNGSVVARSRGPKDDCCQTHKLSAELLQSALSRGEIWPAFQPIVDLQSGAIVAFEILARWTDPIAGAISPTQFIPLAEQCGLIGDLTDKILREACVIALSWQGSFVLAINISPVQFHDHELSTRILRTVRSSGFPVHRVHVEITESALLENDPSVHATIASLKASGIGLALDDFGTGFASLTQLHAFPFNKLKIDMSFVRSMTVDSGSRKIIASVIGLGQSLGMTVVAEGVETEEQATLLRRMGCDLGQGWLFGKAENALETGKLIERRLVGDLSKRKPPAQLFHRVHQLDALYTASPIGLCLLDTNFVHTSVNPRFSAMFALSPDDMIGHTVHSFMPAHEADRVTSDLVKVLNGDTVVIEDYRPIGSDRVFFVINQRVDDDDGVAIGISVTAVDVTGYKTLETLLSQTEDHQRWSIDLSPNIPWASDAAGVVNFMGPTPDCSKIDVDARIEDWMARMHPEDRLRVRQQWLAWIPSGKPFETMFRMRLGDDGFHWMLSRAKPHHGPDGKIIKWYGVITEMAAQQSLRDQLLRLESVGASPQDRSHDVTFICADNNYDQQIERPAKVYQKSEPHDGLSRSHYVSMLMRMFEGAPIAMSITTSDTRMSRYVKVNAAYLKMTGRSWEEIRGKTLLAAGSAIDNSARDRRHRLLLDQGYYELEEVDIVRADGSTVPTLISAQRTTINGTSFDLEIIVDVSERLRQQREAENALKVSARTDALSGLPNRAYFDEVLLQRIAQARGPHDVLVLAYLDLNGFKKINDTLGHLVGDEVLKVISSRLRSEFATQFVARVGGDEFALLIETDKFGAIGLKEMLDQRMQNIFKAISISEQTVTSGAAVGVTILCETDNAHSVLKRADDYMYIAKSTSQRIAVVYLGDIDQNFRGNEKIISAAT
uniref:ABC transporter permease n=1 Tax=Agrobacterium larrymoorei TaxID=160699 RepID=A0A2Z2Q388_9HYPH|nr:EAL domain-containing protein [Agrobacterium larrymoorei]ASK49454.1 ABC transporter permease [Agrobacterium larrymoorei]